MPTTKMRQNLNQGNLCHPGINILTIVFGGLKLTFFSTSPISATLWSYFLNWTFDFVSLAGAVVAAFGPLNRFWNQLVGKRSIGLEELKFWTIQKKTEQSSKRFSDISWQPVHIIFRNFKFITQLYCKMYTVINYVKASTFT